MTDINLEWHNFPAPLVPAGTDLTMLDSFMLNVEKMLASELWALATGDEFKAAFALWMRAWKQIPAGSLPDDERILAGFSGTKNWTKVRSIALRGFVKCSDGRLYHKVLCEDVLRAVKAVGERHDRTKAATAAREKKRHEERERLRNEQRDVERDVHVTESHRQGQGHIEEDGGVVAPASPVWRDVGQHVMEMMEVLDDPRWFGDARPAEAWVRWGADPELDIYPAVERTLRRTKGKFRIKSLNFFDESITEAMANRNRLKPEVSHVNGTGNTKPAKPTQESDRAAILAGLDLDARSGGMGPDIGGAGIVIDADFRRSN